MRGLFELDKVTCKPCFLLVESRCTVSFARHAYAFATDVKCSVTLTLGKCCEIVHVRKAVTRVLPVHLLASSKADRTLAIYRACSESHLHRLGFTPLSPATLVWCVHLSSIVSRTWNMSCTLANAEELDVAMNKIDV